MLCHNRNEACNGGGRSRKNDLKLGELESGAQVKKEI